MAVEHEPFIAAYSVLKILIEEGLPSSNVYISLDIDGSCTLNILSESTYTKYKTLAENLLKSKDWYTMQNYYVLRSDDGLKSSSDKSN